MVAFAQWLMNHGFLFDSVIKSLDQFRRFVDLLLDRTIWCLWYCHCSGIYMSNYQNLEHKKVKMLTYLFVGP